jgi:two-component system, chemotaxis family, protein-glutamate methylesterase/glutaminase
MPARDIVVIGASAGGVEALQQVVKLFPAELPASVFVIMHMAPRSSSFLPDILSRSGPLAAAHASDGDPIEQRRIYIAPPDHHLVVEHSHIHLSMGPKEQRQRPCINVTFRSAALAHGPRVLGVILSGQLDDGTAGLWDVKRRGGTAVVQNPESAAFPSMPLSAVRDVAVDYILPLNEIGPTLAKLCCEDGNGSQSRETSKPMEPKLTDITCPDCRGTIWKVKRGNGSEYRCRVGHTYSAKSMLSEHFATQEKQIWSAIVALEEGAALANELIDQFAPELRSPLQGEARQRLEEASELRQILERRTSFGVE